MARSKRRSVRLLRLADAPQLRAPQRAQGDDYEDDRCGGVEEPAQDVADAEQHLARRQPLVADRDGVREDQRQDDQRPQKKPGQQIYGAASGGVKARGGRGRCQMTPLVSRPFAADLAPRKPSVDSPPKPESALFAKRNDRSVLSKGQTGLAFQHVSISAGQLRNPLVCPRSQHFCHLPVEMLKC